jgi:hypothetical protein
MAQVKQFDPTKDTLNLGGVDVTGWSDSKFTLTPNNSRSTVTEGIDGDISVNIDSRFSGTLTINLMQNSNMCRLLDSWIYSVSTSGGSPFFPVSLKSVTSNAGLGTVGWVQDQPDYETGQETGTRSYVIGVADSRLLPLTQLADFDAIQAYAGAVGNF